MPAASSSAPLHRGSACLSCRKRKLKCDGVRPICQQCLKLNRADQCEYEDRKRKSRTQRLREKMGMLEDRIRQLESTGASSTINSKGRGVVLPDSLQRPPSPPSPFFIDQLNFNLNSGASSSSSDYYTPPPGAWSAASSSMSNGPADGLGSTSSFPVSSAYYERAPLPGSVNSSAPSLYMSQWKQHEPLPLESRKFLTDVFMVHRHQCWFDFDRTRVDPSSTALVPGKREPHPSLLNAIYLLGCHFARASPYCAGLEPVFLQRVESDISAALSSSDHLVDVVQASCLLATYLFANARPLDGYCHSFSAARLAVGLGLHQVQKGDQQGQSQHDGATAAGFAEKSLPREPSILATPIPIHPPQNAEEQKDRISTFWMVFMVDRCWSVANRLPVILPEEKDFTTPWPALTIGPPSAEYESPFNPLPSTSSGSLSMSGEILHLPALRTQAAGLFERTYRLAELDGPREQSYWIECRSVRDQVQRFSASLPMFIGYEAWRTEAPYLDVELFAVHTLTYTSSLNLLQGRSYATMTSQDAAMIEPREWVTSQAAVNSLMSLIRQLTDRDYEFLDPIVAACWATLARHFVSLLKAAASGERLVNIDAPFRVNIAEQELQVVIKALGLFSNIFPFAGECAKRVQEERNSIVAVI